MPDQDAVENKAFAAAAAISEQVGQLWLSAYADGMRTGIECGAMWVSGAADALAGMQESPDYFVGVLRDLADRIRLSALEVPEPEVPSV